VPWTSVFEARPTRAPRFASDSGINLAPRPSAYSRTDVSDPDVLIGGREKPNIVIVDYDDAWPERFEFQRARVADALGNAALRIEHIGSTAVPGLAAKPVIDLVVTVENPDDETRILALESAGYELRVREPGHRMFRSPARDVHVHIWAESDPEVDRHLRFRDQLRRSADDRRTYEQLKRELSAKQWGDMNDYADAKGPLIEAILARSERRPRAQSEPG
jgi:GrpB-like predicted nucleotidyltransferase (UPF0157 family)